MCMPGRWTLVRLIVGGCVAAACGMAVGGALALHAAELQTPGGPRIRVSGQSYIGWMSGQARLDRREGLPAASRGET